MRMSTILAASLPAVALDWPISAEVVFAETAIAPAATGMDAKVQFAAIQASPQATALSGTVSGQVPGRSRNPTTSSSPSALQTGPSPRRRRPIGGSSRRRSTRRTVPSSGGGERGRRRSHGEGRMAKKRHDKGIHTPGFPRGYLGFELLLEFPLLNSTPRRSSRR